MQAPLKAAAVAVALVGLTLVGCTAPSSDTPVGDTPTATDEPLIADGPVVFECPDGAIITAQFSEANTAVVTLPDQEPISLPATAAASGARYSDGTTTFWNKGNEAMVEVNGTVVFSGCQAQS